MTDNGDRSRTPEGVFGKALKFYRERAGLSQTELAALSNYSNTVINKIEKGDRPPAEGFPERMDAIPQLDTRGELSRLWDGPHVMREQLNRLAEAARQPHIVIQVIPAGTGEHEGLRGGAFVIADFADHPAVAYQDTALRGMIVDDAADVASLMFLWDTVKSAALPRAASLELIEAASKKWT
jgi:transcriptional regulator with XRE-family HTH domain